MRSYFCCRSVEKGSNPWPLEKLVGIKFAGEKVWGKVSQCHQHSRIEIKRSPPFNVCICINYFNFNYTSAGKECFTAFSFISSKQTLAVH